jgi:DNA-binding CsgD family transcriptional regulator
MKPRLCIIDNNTLAAIGLKQLLQQVMPIAEVDYFGSITELEANHPEQYAHYFASMSIVLEHRAFFSDKSRKTIVLTTVSSAAKQLNEFNCLYVNVPEQMMIKSLLFLQQQAHGQHGKHPISTGWNNQEQLSPREVEVMTLIVKGLINKEIAERLNISLSTVITHRKNIMDKLGIKSVSALTIYAVMKGYVDINMI